MINRKTTIAIMLLDDWRLFGVFFFFNNCSKFQVLGDLYGRLSIVLVRANGARAILARSLQVADMQVEAMDY